MTEQKRKNIFILSLPIFVELLLQLLVGNVDQFMLSQYSQNSVAAIGNSNQVINIMVIAINVLSTATTVLITQYLGAKNKEKISEVITASTILVGGITLILSLVVIFFCRPLYHFLNVPAEVLDEACSYTRIVASFMVVQAVYMNFASAIRSFSAVKEVMFAAIVMNVLNIIGNAILINGYFGFPQLGITGAAISTNISKCVGLAIVLFIFHRKIDAVFSFRYLRPLPIDSFKRLLRVGLPSGGESFSYNLSQTCIMMFINPLGTAVINARIYCTMLGNISYVYSIAIAQATQIHIGYLMGEGNKDLIPRKAYRTIAISMCMSSVITLLFYFNANSVLGLFTSDPAVINLGRQVFAVDLVLQLGRAINLMMTRTLITTGDIKPPFIVGVICMWSLSVGVGYLLGVQLGMGLVGIWIAMAMDECTRGIIFIFRFNSGVWRKKSII